MIIYLSAIVGLVLWVVLWAIGVKGFDGFLLTMLIALAGAVIQGALPYLPGNRGDTPRRPGT